MKIAARPLNCHHKTNFGENWFNISNLHIIQRREYLNIWQARYCLCTEIYWIWNWAWHVSQMREWVDLFFDCLPLKRDGKDVPKRRWLPVSACHIPEERGSQTCWKLWECWITVKKISGRIVSSGNASKLYSGDDCLASRLGNWSSWDFSWFRPSNINCQ